MLCAAVLESENICILILNSIVMSTPAPKRPNVLLIVADDLVSRLPTHHHYR